MSDEKKPETHLVVQSLTVEIPDSPFKVFIGAYNGAAGVWVQDGDGAECIGLCAVKGQRPYLDIWGSEASGLPTAFCSDGIQVAGPSETDRVFVSFADLVALAKAAGKPESA